MILQTTPKIYVLRRTDRGIAYYLFATLGKFNIISSDKNVESRLNNSTLIMELKMNKANNIFINNHKGKTPNEKMFNMFRKDTITQNARR